MHGLRLENRSAFDAVAVIVMLEDGAGLDDLKASACDTATRNTLSDAAGGRR